ncbi:L-cystine transporter [Pseudoalteromonas luteoviolacea]|uniref:L-cystine transporter tcyP n=1 Tax=Pseudoalteromonas luteoviolacea S4054 TaxID=1129367 RepID=A0A0F6ADA9_9GAMM|nr:L-cystine transporter [Pseudoalteromonas luteoviolacea]AOT06869.1 L-cystine transporter tcyP [Pseudoalteromonas luteoviolacea]AOT11787.1 L-cystine transporter tcyP [Pseudoalteromonas luteoviolacea]AOT16699.1 L-cystine transporter tcyP [Pseudoalteromonas luteoviolacea]KKE83364.1 L-cystine transporter tcyP [Pseudoalteromonas luteoviolacea S4054]KZN74019.1 L-cystine transporter tcyP [Pseudoalteromonas luteoviolacea S4047-1]
MSFIAMVSLAVFAAILIILFQTQKKGATLSRLVLIGLSLGSVFGLALQFFLGEGHQAITETLNWTNVVGSGYVALLKMIIMPLVLVSMVAAVVRLDKSGALGKISGITISVLVVTTMVAALIGIFITQLFGLSAEGLTEGARETSRIAVLESRSETVSDLSIPQMLLSFIPTNIFQDLAWERSTSIIAVVIFGILVGIAARKVMSEREELEAPIRTFVETLQAVVMRLVKMVISLTPYGVAALMAKVVATSSLADITNLLGFIVASYVAIFLMFVVHGVLVGLFGVSPKQFFQKIWPVLTFAFTSRSSAATIPLNVDTQINKLNVPPAIANLSASFGATIGQNGCAGIYPAMLAVMVAPSVGINPMDISFILSLVAIVAISSFGIAGVGGGATFAALIVLPAMGLPVTIAALLISIEPLIDMARTALNVSGSMTAGTITHRILGEKAQVQAPAESAAQSS